MGMNMVGAFSGSAVTAQGIYKNCADTKGTEVSSADFNKVLIAFLVACF